MRSLGWAAGSRVPHVTVTEYTGRLGTRGVCPHLPTTNTPTWTALPPYKQNAIISEVQI